MSSLTSASLVHRPGDAPAVAAALLADREPVESAGGVLKEELIAARKLLAKDRSIVVIAGRSSLAETADLPAQAIAAFRRARPDATFLPALRRANVHGALDMGLAPGILPGRVGLDEGRKWFADAWGQVPSDRGLDAAGICTMAGEGRLHGLVLLGADPAADLPDKKLARRALAAAGFVVAVDSFRNESIPYCDVVLPAAIWGERAGTTTNLEGRITRVGQKVVPPGVCWPDWTIAVELAAALGADLPYSSLEDIVAEIAKLATSHAGITTSVLSARVHRDGVVAPLGSVQPTQPRRLDPTEDAAVTAVSAHLGPADRQPGESLHELKAAPTATPDEDDEASGEPEVARPPMLSSYEAPSTPAVKPDAYKLRLASSRALYDHGTLVSCAADLSALARRGVALHVNPTDLVRFGISDGTLVRVASTRAPLTMTAIGDQGVPKGGCWIPWSAGVPGAEELIDLSGPVTDVSVETTEQ